MNRKKINDVIAEMREFVQACDMNELAFPYDPRRVLMYKGMKLRDVAEKWADELAIAEPARNCDRHGGDYEKLNAEWFEWTGTPEGQNQDGTVKMAFGEWLLALASEDKAEKGQA